MSVLRLSIYPEFYKLLFLAVSMALWGQNNAHAYHSDDKRILEECQLNRRFVYPGAECNDVYHLYESHPAEEPHSLNDKTSEIKIASFNIYLLGSGETRYKDIKIHAQIMQAWDIVGVSEILYSTGIDSNYNKKIISVEKSPKISSLVESKYGTLANGVQLEGDNIFGKIPVYWVPGYLKLLEELQSLEPEAGWSLIISPYTQSENFELAGFFYKSSRVKLISTPECESQLPRLMEEGAPPSSTDGDDKEPLVFLEGKPVYGCVSRFDQEVERRFSRKPFMASFQLPLTDTSPMKLTMLTGHYRFRAANTVAVAGRPLCEEECQENLKGILNFFHPRGKELPYLGPAEINRAIIIKRDNLEPAKKDRANDRIMAAIKFPKELLEERAAYTSSNEEVSRQYEAFHTLALMDRLKKVNPDFELLLGADFNLEYQAGDFWDTTLLTLDPGALLDFLKLQKENGNELALEVFKASHPAKFELLVNTPTSVGIQGPSSAYDHFIIPSQSLKECRDTSGRLHADAFDFTSSQTSVELAGVKTPLIDLLQDYAEAQEDDIEQAIKFKEEEYLYRGVMDKKILKFCTEVKICKKEVQEDWQKMRERVYANRCSEVQNAYEKCAEKNPEKEATRCLVEKSGIEWCQKNPEQPFTPKFFMQVISDHMPIVLTCKKQQN